MIRIKILLTIIVLAIVIIFVTPAIVGPILCHRITVELNEKYTDYIFKIDKVQWSLIPSKVKLEKIIISLKVEHGGASDIIGEIASIQFTGIKLINAIFKNKYEIDEVIISNSHLEGKVPFSNNEKRQTVSSIKIHIGNLLFDQINLSLKDSSSAQRFSVNDGILKIVDLDIEKLDTFGIFNHFDFEAKQMLLVSADSFYTYKTEGIVYSDSIKTLSIEGFYIAPNYTEYEFTARHQYETDRIEAVFSHIYIHRFPVVDYFKSGNLISSYVEVGNMELNVFRDKRKADSNLKRPAFQDVIYNYPSLLHIDSIDINNGNITYTEHAEKANEPGKISLNKLNSRIYNLTNDTIFKTTDASLEIKSQALLMGKSKMTVLLKAKLFDKLNTFSMNGTLGEIDIKELNPLLEKNALIYANSGKINKMSFNFTANDIKSTGQVIMLYNGLNLTVKNKKTDGTTAIKERILSFIANEKAWNSNPTPGDRVRVGIIDYNRDPNKFIVNYCLQSIVSGIKSSIIKKSLIFKKNKNKKNFIQRIFSNVS